MSIKIGEKVKTVSIYFDMPAWMQLAFEGQKISAIKELRDNVAGFGGYYSDCKLSLVQAKNIVENFLDHVYEKVE